MDRKLFILNFSQRLKQQLQKKGYEAARSKAGIDIYKLANMAGCSYQMARKYALGQALPELHIIFKIATILDISPSWLLFGDNDRTLPAQKTGLTIEIEMDVLRYILSKCSVLFSFSKNKEDIVTFIMDTIYDASHLNADKETIQKIIDMMISSATLLSPNKKDNQQRCNI